MTSAFNPETVESFEVAAGGFSAKYGDRLSSILVIENRDGTRQKPFTGSASMAFTDGNIVTEGKLPGDANGSWPLTGRRTCYDLIAEPLVGTNLPGFSDLQLKAVWEPRPGRRLTLFGLGSRERTDAEFDELDTEGERLSLQSSTNNDLAAVSFSSPIGLHTSSKTTVSWYRNRETLDFDGDGNVTELVPQRDAQGFPVWTADYGSASNLNSGRLPLFARVDLRVTFRPRWQNNRWLLYVEVINLLNRDNAGNLETELLYDASSDRPRLTTTRESSLPLLPSFGVRVRF